MGGTATAHRGLIRALYGGATAVGRVLDLATSRGLKPAVRCAAAPVCAVALSGCSLTGSWKTVSVDPPGAPFPVTTLTFDRDGTYSTSWTQGGRSTGSAGRYEWNGREYTTLMSAPPADFVRIEASHRATAL